MCPPERPRSGVSIQKIHVLCVGVNDGCALVGRHGRAHRHRPYPSPSYFSTQSYTNKRTIYMQFAQRKPTTYAQSSKRHQPSMRNLPKRNCRGDACVPARTSAQRRFHTKNTRIVHGELNDGCALVGRHGRAHRHRPYPSPSNHAECHYLITLYIR